MMDIGFSALALLLLMGVVVGGVVVLGLLIKHRQWWVLGGLGGVLVLGVLVLMPVRMMSSQGDVSVSVNGLEYGPGVVSGRSVGNAGLVLSSSSGVRKLAVLPVVVVMCGLGWAIFLVMKKDGGKGLVVTAISLLAFVTAVGIAVGILTQVATPSGGMRMPDISQSQLAPSTGGAWLGSVDSTFDADLYASAEAAGGRLGREIVLAMREIGDDWEVPHDILLVKGDTPKDTVASLVASMKGVLIEQLMLGGTKDRQQLVNAIGVVSDDKVMDWVEWHQFTGTGERFMGGGRRSKLDYDSYDLDAVVRLSIEDVEGEGEGGKRLVARVSERWDDEGEGRVVSVEFVNKPWVGAFDAYASLHPNRQMVLARSGDLATSAEDAHRAAVEHGAMELMRRVGGRIDEPGLALALKGIESGEFVTDRFVQQLSRPYGDVWREAILVETDVKALAKQVVAVNEQNARRAVAQVRHERETWVSMAAGIAGVIVLVGGMYLVLSYATRGYYQWWLRLAVVVFGGAGVLGVVALLGEVKF